MTQKWAYFVVAYFVVAKGLVPVKLAPVELVEEPALDIALGVVLEELVK